MVTTITPGKTILESSLQKPSGKLYLGTEQPNLVDRTNTLIELDTISPNFTDGIENIVSHRITPGVAGFYILTGQVTFINQVANKPYKAWIKISGGLPIAFNTGWAGGGSYFSLPVSTEVKLTAADYVELWGRSESGDNNVDIMEVEYNTFLCVQRVR